MFGKHENNNRNTQTEFKARKQKTWERSELFYIIECIYFLAVMELVHRV